MSPLFRISPLALAASLTPLNAEGYSQLIRLEQNDTKVVRVMPFSTDRNDSAPRINEADGAILQIWTVRDDGGEEILTDERLVGVNAPKAAVTIRATDSYKGVPRTRVDQPFSVDFQVKNLPPGASVLAEHHLAGNPCTKSADSASTPPFSSGYIGKNGVTTVRYDASSIKEADPRKARGEERFAIHALSEKSFRRTRLAEATLTVWPMATASISGIVEGSVIRGIPAELTMAVDDLYPRSATYLTVHRVGGEPDSVGKLIPGSAILLNQEAPASLSIPITGHQPLFGRDGSYRIDLVTKTPFGAERLDSVSFTLKRTLQVNAAQVSPGAVAE